MNKMNKKGFTLIEMLVVIAIIAVLVSIIIPVVGDSTTKAAAAANAANLRSYKATLVTSMLTDDTVEITASGTGATATYTVTVDSSLSANAPKSKEVGAVDADVLPTVTSTDGVNLIVCYGTNTIDDFAKVASGDAEASSLAAAAKPSN